MAPVAPLTPLSSVTHNAAPRLPAPASLPRSISCLLLAFLLGVVWQLQQADVAAPAGWGAQGFYAAVALATLAGLLVCVNRKLASQWARRWPMAACLLPLAGLVLAAALGFSLTAWRAAQFQSGALMPGLEGQNLVLTGRVQSMPQVNEDGVRFRFKPESARLQAEGNGEKAAPRSDEKALAIALPPLIELGWYAGFGARQLASGDVVPEPQQQPMAVRAGDRWQFTVRLKAPHGSRNPHGFDLELWLWEQGVQATGYVRAGPRDAPPQRLHSSHWARPIERARQATRDAIVERVGNRQHAGILAALVVGDQNAIDRADWDVFRATGVAHLMSISGLHITMFAWVAALLIGHAWRRSVRLSPALCLAVPAASAAAIGGLLLATGYALFSGWGVPAQRTIAMLATLVLLRQSGRQWPWPLVWLLAMFVVALLDPWALMQAGFWLSFVAVGVLFATHSGAVPAITERATARFDAQNAPAGRFSAQTLRRALLPVGQGALRAAREQWAITLALAPLSLLLFNQVSVIGLVANALAIPWVTLVVTPLALLGALWPPVWDAAAAAVQLLGIFLQALARWPLASLSAPAAPLLLALAALAGGALLVAQLPWRWRLLGVPLMLPVVLWQPLRPPVGQFEVLGADVGQGNAVLVRTAGHSLVYDAGPRFSRDSDAGHRVLVPLLRAMGEKLDTLMLSHRDADHTGGASAVLAMQPEARLVSSIEDTHPLQAQRPSARCTAGQRWRWDGVDFEVLHPPASSYGPSDGAVVNANTLSCVLRISNGAQTALLAGDIEAAQEAALLADAQARAQLKADFLLVPHHGSKTSSSAAFLEAVAPRFALAQTGYRNRFGHPAPPVMARYHLRGVQTFNSPECGAATWRSDAPGNVLCQREQARRYWHHRHEQR